jgi:chromosome segregation ATPase
LVQQNENDLRAVDRDLERITRSVNDKKRVKDQINKTYQNLATQADRRRTAQAENDRQLSQAKSRVEVVRKDTAQLAQKLYTVDKDVKKKQDELRINTHFNQDSNEDEKHDYRSRKNEYVQLNVSYLHESFKKNPFLIHLA